MIDKGVRIYDLARRLAVPSRELINMLKKRGIEVTSHMSSVNSETADLILETFGAKKPGEAKKAETAKYTPSKPKQRKKPDVEAPRKGQKRQPQADQPEKQEKPYQRGRPRKGQRRESDQTYTKDKPRGHVSGKRREGVSRSKGQFRSQEEGLQKSEGTASMKKTEKGPVARRYDKPAGTHRAAGRKRGMALRPGQTPQPYRRKRRKKPRYASEERRVKGTWDLQPETLERIRVLAEKLEVAQYALVEKMISDWLDLYEAGEVELKKVAVVTTWGIE